MHMHLAIAWLILCIQFMKKDNIKAQEIFWKNLADITRKKYSLDLFYSVKKYKPEKKK